MEEALYLTNFASEVTVIHRRDELRASRIMAERALSHAKINFLWNTVVDEVLGEDVIRGLAVRDVVTGERREIEVGGLFVAIGHQPNTEFLEGQVELESNGYVKLPTGWRTETSVPGVFAAGDVMDSYYRQAVSAAGTGCMAALEAERWLAHGGIDSERHSESVAAD
jgi:thioredoxin reductase (NADPH)